MLAGNVVAPLEEDRLFTETVWRLPDKLSVAIRRQPGRRMSRRLLPAINRYLTFGSFNNLNKVNDRTLALWARLLAASPEAKLAFKGARLRRDERGGRAPRPLRQRRRRS